MSLLAFALAFALALALALVAFVAGVGRSRRGSSVSSLGIEGQGRSEVALFNCSILPGSL